MIVIPQGPFDESLDRAFLRLAADVCRACRRSTGVLVLVIFAPRARRAAMFVPLLRCTRVNVVRARDHDLLAVIVVRLVVIAVARPDEPVTAFILVDFGGNLPVVVEVVCAPASMAGPTPRPHGGGMPLGPRAGRPAGWGGGLLPGRRLLLPVRVGAGPPEGRDRSSA